MYRKFFALLLGLTLVACDGEKKPADESVGALDGIKNAAGDASKGLEGKLEEAETTAKGLGDDAKANIETTAAKLDGAAGSLSENLGSALEGSFDLSKLKEAAGSLAPEKLKGLADQLLSGIQKQDGLIQSLKDQIAKAGAAAPAALKSQLEGATGQLGGLKEKLTFVVSKLKESGIDVSKYLGGS